jgi:hypothetical protein
MATVTYDKDVTALLVIDPYNDFISDGGKLWGRLKAVAEANSCVPHMSQVLNAARKAGLRTHGAHLCGGNGTLRRRARLRGHSRSHRDHQSNRRLDLFCPSLTTQCAVV